MLEVAVVIAATVEFQLYLSAFSVLDVLSTHYESYCARCDSKSGTISANVLADVFRSEYIAQQRVVAKGSIKVVDDHCWKRSGWREEMLGRLWLGHRRAQL